MRVAKLAWVNLILVMVLVISHQMPFARSQITPFPHVGVNYGFNGNNLPIPYDVISLLKSKLIHRIRIFEPKPQIYEDLRTYSYDIEICLGIRNEDIPHLASSEEAAYDWAHYYVYQNITRTNIMWVTVGNEVIGKDAKLEPFVGEAMSNLISALAKLGLEDIFVSTVVSADVLTTSYPPSEGTITNQYLQGVLRILEAKNQPLMVNLYPYFALTSDPTHISPDFALFNSESTVFTDQGRDYYNLFDAMYDAFLAAIAKSLGKAESPIKVMVAESGWPSGGGEPYATVENARLYNTRLREHAAKGSPRSSGAIDVFLFSLFDENLKAEGIQQHFGIYYPSMEPKYPFW